MARAAELHHRLKLRKFSGFQSIKLPESTGEADGNVQAFNYRTILSSDPANRLPVKKPAGYDPERLKRLESKPKVVPIPNSKYGWNRPQLVGLQTDYVEADWPGRQKVMDAHWEATLALLYFLQNDPAVDPAVQKTWRAFGLAKDEFTDNGRPRRNARPRCGDAGEGRGVARAARAVAQEDQCANARAEPGLQTGTISSFQGEIINPNHETHPRPPHRPAACAAGRAARRRSHLPADKRAHHRIFPRPSARRVG